MKGTFAPDREERLIPTQSSRTRFQQGEPSLLARLQATVGAWVGTEVEAAWVQPLRDGPEPSAPSSVSRVWLVTPGVINADHTILYRRDEVRRGSQAARGAASSWCLMGCQM